MVLAGNSAVAILSAKSIVCREILSRAGTDISLQTGSPTRLCLFDMAARCAGPRLREWQSPGVLSDGPVKRSDEMGLDSPVRPNDCVRQWPLSVWIVAGSKWWWSLRSYHAGQGETLSKCVYGVYYCSLPLQRRISSKGPECNGLGSPWQESGRKVAAENDGVGIRSYVDSHFGRCMIYRYSGGISSSLLGTT